MTILNLTYREGGRSREADAKKEDHLWMREATCFVSSPFPPSVLIESMK
jgi:hypothetical protein